MPFECAGFVDHHTHLLRVSGGGSPPWRDRSEVRAFHEHCSDAGKTPVDDLEEPPPGDALQRGLERGLTEAKALGLVEVWEAGVRSWSYLDSLLELREGVGSLPVRVRLLIAAGLAEEGMRTRLGDVWCEIEGLKFYSDGWLGTRTCALSRSFTDEPENHGLLFETAESLARRAEPFARAGWLIATHAIGDRAIGAVLDAYEMIYGTDCPKAAPRIEHAQVLSTHLIERVAAMGVTACIQPSFGVADHDAAHRAIGDRTDMAYRWDLLAGAGVRTICGSDYPIESLDPLVGLRDLISNPFAPMSCAEALALMTNAESGTTTLSADPCGASDAEPISVLGTDPAHR